MIAAKATVRPDGTRPDGSDARDAFGRFSEKKLIFEVSGRKLRFRPVGRAGRRRIRVENHVSPCPSLYSKGPPAKIKKSSVLKIGKNARSVRGPITTFTSRDPGRPAPPSPPGPRKPPRRPMPLPRPPSPDPLGRSARNRRPTKEKNRPRLSAVGNFPEFGPPLAENRRRDLRKFAARNRVNRFRPNLRRNALSGPARPPAEPAIFP
jgi:hypothetical protein